MERYVRCWGGKWETTKRMALSILGRGAERVQKACYWCHRDFKKRVWCSASRDLLRCKSVVKLKEKLPRMLLTQTCLFPLALTLPFASLPWPFGFRFHVIADVAIAFCDITPICARICREGKVTDHKERQHVSVNLWRYSLKLLLLSFLHLKCESIDSGIASGCLWVITWKQFPVYLSAAPLHPNFSVSSHCPACTPTNVKIATKYSCNNKSLKVIS